MTIIDAHTHMPGVAVTGITGHQQQAFIDLLDHNGVDQAWVFTLDGLFFDPTPHNPKTVEFCSFSPSRLIPFCTVYPRDPKAADELRHCVRDLGMRGLKLHPSTYTMTIYVWVSAVGGYSPTFRLGYGTAMGVILLILVMISYGIIRLFSPRYQMEY